MEWSAKRLSDEVDLLASRGLPRGEFFGEVSERLRKVIPNDAACWHTLDPQTRLLTSDSPDELVAGGIFTADETPAAGALIVRSEYVVDDVNTFADLAGRRVPVGILDHATRGSPGRSARYRDLLEPAGIPHELRAALVIRGRVWGAVHVARRAGSGPFEQRDAEALAAALGAIAGGVRASLRFDAARRATGVDAPGLVVLGAGNETEMITPPARELLDALRDDAAPHTGERVPTAVLALASFVRSAPATARDAGSVVTVPGRDGWIMLHASRPGAPGDDRVAIVVERAGAARSATVRLEAFGATPREREVATLLARGLSRAEIAETLVVSPHTVEDHVSSLYGKLGVSSRQDLVARVFLDEYLPEIVRRTPLSSRGRFDRPEDAPAPGERGAADTSAHPPRPG